MKKNCVICGNEFEVRFPNLTSKTDSAECLRIKRLKYDAEYRLKNPGKLKKARARYRANNPSKAIASTAKWRSQNYSRYRASVDQWRKENKDKVQKRDQERYLKHREMMMIRAKQWRALHKEQSNFHAVRSRRRKKLALNTLKIANELQQLKKHLTEKPK